MRDITESAKTLCSELLDGSQYNPEVLSIQDLLDSYKQYYLVCFSDPDFDHYTWWVNSFYQCYHKLEPEEIWNIPVENCIELMSGKNRVYGSEQLKFGGTSGIALRSVDKLYRLKNMKEMGITEFGDESLRDTIIDLFNYSILALLLLRKEL